MTRGQKQRESKVLRQQLRQVEMNDGVTGARGKRGKLGVCVEKEGERDRKRAC